MALRGTLKEMSLSDLFQVFRIGSKTGVLYLVTADLRGIVHVAAGRLTDAAVIRPADRAVISVHDDAVIQMLLWDEATFVFRHDSSALHRPVRIHRDAEQLVLESVRRRDNPQLMLPYHHVTLDTCLRLSPLSAGLETNLSLDMRQWRLLSYISEHSCIGAIARATNTPPDRIIRQALELMAIGLIEVAPAPLSARPSSQRCKKAVTENGDNAGYAARVGSYERCPPARRSLIEAVMRRVRGL